MQTTIGQIMVNDALPESLRDYSRTLTKDEADALLASVAEKYPRQYKDISWQLMQLGREAAFSEGTTLKLSNLRLPFDTKDLINHVKLQEKKIKADRNSTPEEKEQALDAVYNEVQKLITDQTYQAALAEENPFALQVKSKARGNPAQLAALLATPSVYQDAKDKTIPVFIGNSYSHGLAPHEYWAATYGARKAIISTKFATREAGYLGKQFGTAVAPLVVTESDCGTPYGMPVPADDDDNIGSLLARPAGGFPIGTVITKEVLAKFGNKKIDEIVVRSPITCSVSEGVCKHCAGVRETGRFPEIGYHLGHNAAAALAERIAQSSLNQKHSGGQDMAGNKVYAGFNVIQQLTNIPKVFPDRASLSEVDGNVESIEPAAQGGTNIVIDGKTHYVSPDLPVRVKVGDTMEQGDAISDGIVNPAEVVKYKGIGEGRRYFVERLTKAFRDSKYGVNRRNIEALTRAMVNHVAISEQGGLGSSLPGDIVSYNSVAYNYRPRKDSRLIPVKQAIGQYLEQPALHHTIGTRLTKKMSAQLTRHGVASVLANAQPAGFVPDMVSLVKVPQYEDDWMARLSSNYLKSRLLEDVQRGATSNIHGLHPAPAIAKGTELGKPRGKKFTF